MKLSTTEYRGVPEIRAKVSYEDKNYAKSIRGYRWRSEDKQWAYPYSPVMAQDLYEHFKSCGLAPEISDHVQSLIEASKKIKNGGSNHRDYITSEAVPPWDHQREATRWMLSRHAGLLHMEMGTGKSKCVVDWTQTIRPWAVIVVAPKTAMGVWKREFDLHATNDFEYSLSSLPNSPVPDRIGDAQKNITKEGTSVVVLNYAAARRKKFKDLVKNHNIEAVVADESHRIKSPNSQQSKSFSWLHGRVKYRWGLTGTPMPKGPEDLYAQFRFIDQGVFGRSYKKFKNRYCRMGGYENKQIVGYKNQDKMSERLGWFEFRVDESALDLPEAIEIDRKITLSEDQYTVLSNIEGWFRERLIETEGELPKGEALKKLLKMQQATSGFVKPDPDSDKIDRIESKKEDVLEDIIQDTDEKIVVFARFRHDLNSVKRITESTGLTYGEVSGRQKDLTESAEMPSHIDVMGVQLQAGAEGIDLTEATVGVFYSFGFSLGNYLQAKRRLHRPGQNRPVRFFRLIGAGSVDEKIVGAIEGKKDVVDHLISLVNSNSNEGGYEQTDLFSDRDV